MSVQHQQPAGQPGHERRLRAVTVVLVLACVLLAAIGLKLSEPSSDNADEHGRLEQPVMVNGARLTVGRLRTGSVLEVGDETLKTPGLFVVVTARFEVRELKRTLSTVTLEGGGYTYQPYHDSSLSADPGFVTTADFVFEVDPARLRGLTFTIKRGEIIHSVQSRAVIDLGIDTDQAKHLRGTAGQTVRAEEFSDTKALS